MANKLYLAYGSNLNIRQMRMRCPGAKVAGTATIADYELLFKGSMTGSFLTIERKDGASVPVGVWQVTEADVKALDRYEGYPKFYYRKSLFLPVKDIQTGQVRKCRAFVYIMHEERALGIPCDSYVRTCTEGYKDFGFDTDFLERAISISKEALQ